MNDDFAKKIALPLVLVALVTGCDAKKDGASTVAKPKLEAAAKVNGSELSAQEINLMLQRMPNSEAKPSKDASIQMLRNLVEQEVIAQKAVADKLDQDPAVTQMLNMMRRQVLADAYMSRKLGKQVAPSDADVTAYFDKHPELFTQRKIYRLQEISIQAAKDKQESIRARLAASKTLNDFAAWLKAENFPVKAAQGVKPAEQLPFDILPKLSQMPNGQAIVVNAPDGLMVIVLVDSQVQPVTLEQVKPVIAQLLQAQSRQKAAKAELDALKRAAKIEYLGEFVDTGKLDATAETPATGAAPTATAGEANGKGVAGQK